MTATIEAPFPSDLSELASDEHQLWRRHRELLLRMDARDVGYRGCIGLALLVAPTNNEDMVVGDRLFIRDLSLRWACLQDLPRGHFRLASPREVHWATLRTTALRYGVPALGPGGLLGAWDFRAMPFDALRKGKALIRAQPHILSPSRHPQLFKVFNRLNWAMTSTAFQFRSRWRAQRRLLFEAVGEPFRVDAGLLLIGDNRKCETLPDPAAWMPRSYRAFPASLGDSLWDWVTGGGQRCYHDSLRRQFGDDLAAGLPIQAPCDGRFDGSHPGTHHGFPVTVLRFSAAGSESQTTVRASRHVRLSVRPGQSLKAGDVVAQDGPPLPAGWARMDLHCRWAQVRAGLVHRDQLDGFLRAWFERQVVRLRPGLVHVPGDLAAVAAQGLAVDAELYWDVTPTLPYFAESCDAFLLPTLRIHKWDDFAGTLPGEVRFEYAFTGRGSD